MTTSDPWLNPSSFTSPLTSQPSSAATAPAEYIHPFYWHISKIKAQTQREWWEPWKEACLKGSEHKKTKIHLEMIPGCFHHICAAEVIYLPLKRVWLPVSESLLKTFCRKELSTPYCQMPRDLCGTNSHWCLSACFCSLGSEDCITGAVIRGSATSGAVGDEGCICGRGLCILSISWFPVCSLAFLRRKLSRRLQYFPSRRISLLLYQLLRIYL